MLMEKGAIKAIVMVEKDHELLNTEVIFLFS